MLKTHNLLSGSFSLTFSSTLISSRAASLYFSTFLIIFRATWTPPLKKSQRDDQISTDPTGMMRTGINSSDSRLRFLHVFLVFRETDLRWSMHSITLPKVPSPNVPTISSATQCRQTRKRGGARTEERTEALGMRHERTTPNVKVETGRSMSARPLFKWLPT